jgi:DNA modification methylase
MLEALSISYVPVADLIPYARNPRTHTDEQVAAVAASIREFGWTNPVLVDGSRGIIAGHGRVLAARKLGLEHVPVISLAHLSDAQRRAYVIADNQLALRAGWDDALLRLELGELGDMGFDLGLLGFEDADLKDLLAPAGTEGLTDPDEAPQLPDTPVSVAGDVWILGRHRLVVGSATVMDDVTRLLAGQRADMAFTDPPYNVDYDGGASVGDSLRRAGRKGGKGGQQVRSILNDAMTQDQFLQFCRDFFSSYVAALKPGASIYVCHSDRAALQFRQAFEEAGYHFSSMLIWAKDSHTLGRSDYHSRHEPILYGWHASATHAFYGGRAQNTVWEIPRPKASEFHPTQKPVELVERALANSSKSGDLVLDLFGGSGSTLIAAEKTGRTAFLMELDPRYADVIILRWQAFTGHAAFHEADGRSFTEYLGERTPGKVLVPGAKEPGEGGSKGGKPKKPQRGTRKATEA